MTAWRRAGVAAVLVVACAGELRSDRAAELAACQLISQSGDKLAECLVMKYSWRAESAGPAKTAWQWQLDSIRRDHDTQAARVAGQQWVASMRAALVRSGMPRRRADSLLRREMEIAGDPPNLVYLRELGRILLETAELDRQLRGAVP